MPNAALTWLLVAKGWTEAVEEVSFGDCCKTLIAKTGKAFRAVAKGRPLKEIVIMEERMLRKHASLLDGRVVYAMFMREFEKSARLAKSFVME